MVSRSLLVTAATAFLVMAAVPAVAVEMQPGLWEVSSKSERDGVVTTRPTKTQCITPEKAKEASGRTSIEFSISRGSETCKIVDSQKTDKGMNWRMQCAGPIPAEQTGSSLFDSPQHYTTITKTTATAARKTLTSTMTVEGRRIGECPK